MVLEKLLGAETLRTKPGYAILTGLFFVFLGFFSSMLIFSSEVSLVMVALSSLMLLPYVVKIFEFDELDVDIDKTNTGELRSWVKKCLRDGFSPQQIKDNLIRNNLDKSYDLIYDLTGVDEEYVKHIKASNVFSRHSKTIEFYVYLFLGMFLAYTTLFMVMRPETDKVVFKNQLSVVSMGPSGYFTNPQLFWKIISNNLAIVVVCVSLSVLYGSGAIFILNYNASIAGVFYGIFIKALLKGSGMLWTALYIPHTTIEILGYLLAAISGGILSKTVIGEQPGSQKIFLKDGGIMLLLSILLILVGGYIETLVLGVVY